MLWILVVSSASSSVSGGRIVANRLASMDLPVPGGPMSKTLWPPAAAISNARLTFSWPLTSAKSTSSSKLWLKMLAISTRVGEILTSPSRKPTASRRFWTGMTCKPATTPASAAFSGGTRIPARPSARARSAIGSTPLTDRTAPLSASSPTMTKFSSWSLTICSLAAAMPMAIGRSKLGPSFFTSAGARLMVVRPKVNEKPELISAVMTRSRDSLTAASGSPTITIRVSP